MAYGLMMEHNEWDRASEYLSSLRTDDQSQLDFVFGQNLFLEYINSQEKFTLSSDQRSLLRDKALQHNEWSGFNRAIYELLTSEQLIMQPVEDEESIKSRSTFKTAHSTVKIYPNPTSTSMLNIEIPTDLLDEAFTVRVLDITNRLLLTETKTKGIQQIDLQTQNKGVFFIEVIGDQGFKTVEKIIYQ